MEKKEFSDDEREEIENWARELADLIGKHFLKPPDPVIQAKCKALREKLEGKGFHVTWEITDIDFEKMEGKADVTLHLPKHTTIQ